MNVIDDLCREVHAANVAAGWWTDLNTGLSILETRNVPEMLCLIHSEISEAVEGFDQHLMDDKLPHRRMFEVELADVDIRIFDLAGAKGLAIGTTIEELHGVAVGVLSEAEVKTSSSSRIAAPMLRWLGCDLFMCTNFMGRYSGVPGDLLQLHGFVSEAMEGHRKNKMSSELPCRTVFEVALAKAVALTLVISHGESLSVGDAIIEKMAYNANRADHKPENRRAAGGKAY